MTYRSGRPFRVDDDYGWLTIFDRRYPLPTKRQPEQHEMCPTETAVRVLGVAIRCTAIRRDYGPWNAAVRRTAKANCVGEDTQERHR